MMRKSHARQAGFSLVELAIVMIISSFLMVGFLGYYNKYKESEAKRHTEESIKTLNAAIKQFLVVNMRLPCPANPTDMPGDINFGREDCSGASITVATATGVDRDSDGVDDEVLIGMVPFRDLFDDRDLVPLTLADSLDGWDNRYTYAVTRQLTSAITYNKERGAINVVDEFNKSLQLPASQTHYVLISHGPNGVGAFSADGVQTEPCSAIVVPPSTPPAAVTPNNERENCNGDFTFVSGLRRDGAFAMYDDLTKAYMTQDTKLWKIVGADMAANTNIGNVAVNLGATTGAPQEKLHVMGNIQVNTTVARDICDSNGAAGTCMPVEVLSGSRLDMMCNSNQGVTRIANNQLRAYCQNYRPVRPAIRCTGTDIMMGYDTVSGTLICVPRP